MTEDLLGVQSTQTLFESLERSDAGQSYSATRTVSRQLDALTLSERARAIARAILTDVDGDRDRLSRVIRASLEDGEFGGWTLWPLGLAASWSAIEAGTDAAFDTGMEHLRALTPRMSSEFSIRPMLLHDIDRGLGHLREWTNDPNWHVRRLASEGSRPLLPWGERLPALVRDPAPTLPILDALYADPEESVRRSVANHLNDHSRGHADVVVSTVRGWQAAGGTDVERTVRHALRTLVKRGNVDALDVLGFSPAEVEVAPVVLSADIVPVGGDVRFSAEVRNIGDRPSKLVIDYVLTFPGARGDERSKVFKIAQRQLEPGERTEIETGHSFRAITTRKYYPGRYGVALQVNGVQHARTEFMMEEG